MKTFMMYLTPNSAMVEISNGVSRKTSASTLTEMIAGMPAEDLRVTSEILEQVYKEIAQRQARLKS